MFRAIWYHLYNSKNVKNTHGRVLLLVKLQAKSLQLYYRVATLFMRWKLRRFEEIWGGIINIFEICQNLAKNLRRNEEISHIYDLVFLTFTDVMSSNITVCSRRNTTLTVSKKWTFNMKLCNLYYIILTIWTHIICTWTNFLSHQYLQVYRIKNTL